MKNSSLSLVICLMLPLWAHAMPEDLGVYMFNQSLNTDLSVNHSKDGRDFNLKPEPPSFTGVGASYKGFGFAYQRAATEDRLTRSDAKGFNWTVPYKFLLFEVYQTEFHGMAVEGSAFREDISAYTHGVVVTWAFDNMMKAIHHEEMEENQEMDFSTIFGLERNLSEAREESIKHTFLAIAYQSSFWRGDTAFIPVTTGPDDELAFRYLRRRLIKMGIGRTYVRYYKYARLSLLGSAGLFGGSRRLRYDGASNEEEKEEAESGFAVSAGFSLASDIGFRRLGKKYDMHFNYGLNLYFHSADSFGTTTIGTGETASQVYLGALW